MPKKLQVSFKAKLSNVLNAFVSPIKLHARLIRFYLIILRLSEAGFDSRQR
jgi:hypothetical protein